MPAGYAGQTAREYRDPDGYGYTTTAPAALTGATAGTPGAWTPATAYAPNTVSEALSAPAPTPATAWLTGEYVDTRSGDGTVYWNGTAWVEGVAP
jgi:hypothetical protein